MDIKIACPHCGQHLLVDSTALGQQVTCSTCSTPFTIADNLPSSPTRSAKIKNRISLPWLVTTAVALAILATSGICFFAGEKSRQGAPTSPLASAAPTTLETATLPAYRAIHLGGNWGFPEDIQALPQDHFSFLKGLHVNWVGISVALHCDDSMDGTVERVYTGVDIPTFTDETLVQLIRRCKQDGHRVYLTLAFEGPDNPKHPLQRWQLGDPNIPKEDPKVKPEFWPWSLTHQDHRRFVTQFWDSYTQQATYFARIAEQEKVDLFSLGTETDRLFRTRSGGHWKNNFGDQLRTMVRKVRTVYSGKLTYAMQSGAIVDDFYAAGSNNLWDDLGLDVVGISAYFKLSETATSEPADVERCKQAWERIFAEHLEPLKRRNPTRPLVFLEFGYCDSVHAPYEPNAEAFAKRGFTDANHNQVDDGQETQANIYAAFFDVMEHRHGIVQGAFLWDHFVISDKHWAEAFASHRGMSVRGKEAQKVVTSAYARCATPSR